MDFIEKLFGISPDGGDGSTELIYFAVLTIVITALAWRPISRWYASRSACVTSRSCGRALQCISEAPSRSAASYS